MDEKPPIEPYLRALADKDRRNLGDHPTPEELVAYRAGELTAEDEERIRDHLALCRDCSQLLLDLKDFEEGAREEESGLSDDQVEAAWRRLRPRLEEKQPPAVIPMRRKEPAPLRRRLQVAYALAASLFLCTVGLAVWGGVQRNRVIELSGPVTNPELLELLPEGDGTRGGESEEPAAPVGALLLSLHLPTDAPEEAEYEAEIVTAPEDGKVLRRLMELRPKEYRIVTVWLPEGLPPGEYWIRLYRAGSTQLLGRYVFEVSPQEDLPGT